MTEAQKIGYRGEQLAARYLFDKGYEIVSSSYATKEGEIDIIARKRKLLCFVEVKTRSPGGMLPPAEAVDFYKQERIRSAAAAFVKRAGITELSQRYDICEIILTDLRTAEITYHENAF